jgi:hypothetical protein
MGEAVVERMVMVYVLRGVLYSVVHENRSKKKADNQKVSACRPSLQAVNSQTDPSFEKASKRAKNPSSFEGVIERTFSLSGIGYGNVCIAWIPVSVHCIYQLTNEEKIQYLHQILGK